MKAVLSSILILFLFASVSLNAQITQTLRGKVIDKESQFPLIGVNIVIDNSNPLIGVATNQQGEFTLPPLPLGSYNLTLSYLGYKPMQLRNIVLASGKQKVIDIEMEEQAITTAEVTVQGYRKGETLNQMATVSARSFTVNETERYAGSLGDPARMASNYAGVVQAGDGRNDIIIRGNSPTGLQWRLDGMDIPNPNHWGASGSTGGPVTILNNNVLANSDFFTGAFPAQYGNAISGVFDLRMRSGNNQETEFTGQIGYNGFELMAEGPFTKSHNGSYMVSARYSVLDLMDKIGYSPSGGYLPEYWDITTKADLPTQKAGRFSMFAIAGHSNINIDAEEVTDSEQFNTSGGSNTQNGSDLVLLGATHQYFLNDKSYLFTTASLSGTRVTTQVDSVWNEQQPDSSYLKMYKSFYGEKNHELSATGSLRYVYKFNSKNNLTLGSVFKSFNISVHDSAWVTENNTEYFRTLTNTDINHINTLNTYAEWQHKFNNQFTLNTGLHYQQLFTNNTKAFEPRAGITYEPNPWNRFGLGYGLHSKMQPFFYYFIETPNYQTGAYFKTNEQLDFTRAHHFVLSYNHTFTQNLHLKIETYYQRLFDVPVTKYASDFSMLNEGASFHLSRVDSLVNKGKGQNYGIEVTFERYLSNHFYFMMTGSLFDSKYTASDNIVRHTAFAANYATNILGGYEYKFSEHFSLDANIRTVYTGGKRNPYINLEASRAEGEAVYDESKSYSEREKDYFRLDLRIGLKNNKPKYSQEWAIDISNLTNHKNVFMQTYNAESGEIDFVYQQGFFPMFLYRINF